MKLLAADPAAGTKSIEKAMIERSYALKELVDSEERYVNSLSLVVDKYWYEIRNQETGIPLPKNLRGAKLRMVFSNIDEIYEWHKKFVFNGSLIFATKRRLNLNFVFRLMFTAFWNYYELVYKTTMN